MHSHQQQRLAILKVLYAARETAPDKGWVNLAQIREAVGPGDFALSYLEERGHVAKSGFSYRITASGIDAVEAAVGG